MAYDGYIMKFGNDEFDMGWIFRDTFAITPNRRQDLDSYRNANGKLVRNVLDHTATTITFQSKPMTRHNFALMMEFIRDHFSNAQERKLSITYYSPDINAYKTGNFYMPDFEVTTIMQKKSGELLYNTCTLEFIEY